MVQLTATNLDDFATYTVQSASSLEPMDVLVPFEPLSKIIKGCSAKDTITIGSDKKQLVLTYPVGASRLEQKLEVIATDEFPAVPEVKEYDSITVGEDFKQAIVEALDSASTDECRYILNSAFIDVSDPKAHYIVATNGKELYSANSFQLGFKDSVIVPNRKFLVWKGFLEDGDWNVAVSTLDPKKTNAGWIRVQSNQWTLITKQIDGTYPHWKAPIPNPQEAKAIVSFTPEASAFVLNAAPRMPGASLQSEPVAIKTEKNSVFLAGKDQTNEAVLPVVGANVVGESTVIGLNRQLLMKAMKLGLNTAELHTGANSMPIAVFHREGKRLVIAGLRPDVAEAVTSNHKPQPAPRTSSSDATQDEPQQDEKQEMKTANRIEHVPTETTNSAPAPASAFDQVRNQLENVKEKLRGVLTDLNDSSKLLTQAQKERRATEKEIEEVRETLQSLRKIRI